MKKDKTKVLDEVWTEDRIKSFLDILPPSGVNKDFFCLLKSYQQMREEDFVDLITYFLEAKRDINAVNEDGETILQYIIPHRRSTEFQKILKDAGAK